ncbi:hypothetical protein J3R83DRAFT_13590 [Lanmaoa asiatica]|nr:hypothetical protein J3R83DRAFT_13590 [Lanmaoa asiatica]
MLREAGYNFARDIDRPNNKEFTSLCIALKILSHDLGVFSHLLDLGADFWHVNWLYLDNLEACCEPAMAITTPPTHTNTVSLDRK